MHRWQSEFEFWLYSHTLPCMHIFLYMHGCMLVQPSNISLLQATLNSTTVLRRMSNKCKVFLPSVPIWWNINDGWYQFPLCCLIHTHYENRSAHSNPYNAAAASLYKFMDKFFWFKLCSNQWDSTKTHCI